MGWLGVPSFAVVWKKPDAVTYLDDFVVFPVSLGTPRGSLLSIPFLFFAASSIGLMILDDYTYSGFQWGEVLLPLTPLKTNL